MRNFCPKCGTKLISAKDYTMIGDQTATMHRIPYCPEDGLLTSGSKVSRTRAIIKILLHLCANLPVLDVPTEHLIETIKKLKSHHRNIPDNIILSAISKEWNLDLKIPVLCIYCWSETIVFSRNRDYICINCGKHFKEEEFQTLIDELLLSVEEFILSLKQLHFAEVVKDLDKSNSEQVLSQLANSKNSAVALVSKAIFNARYKNDNTLIRNLNIIYYKDAVRYLQDLDKVDLWLYLGNFNYEFQNFEVAIQLYGLARTVLEKKGMMVEVAKIEWRQANVYFELGKFENALELYKEARKVFENKGMEIKVAIIDKSRANVYFELGKFENALELYKEARKVFENKEMEIEVAIIDGKQAGVYFKLGKYVEALKLYALARTLFEKKKE